MGEAETNALLRAGARLLSEALDQPVQLHDPRSLSEQHPVLRCRVAGSRDLGSAILKQVTRTDFNAPGATEGVSQRLRNEWACLAFLAELPLPAPAGPRLLAASREGSFVILEDLGEGETLLDRLTGSDAAAARAGLVGLGAALGRLQAAAAGREAAFRALQDSLGAASPLSDSTIDQRQRRARFEDCFGTLRLEPARGFWEELAAVEAAIHDAPGFRSLLHADAGPHNVLHPETGGGRALLLDFEFGAYRQGLLDVVSARLGFPHAGQVWSVPEADARALEDAYRAEILGALPEAADDAAFESALVDACAHWSLSRWSGYWTGYFKERLDPPTGSGEEEADPQAAERHARHRSRVVTPYEGFLALAERTGRRPAIAVSLRRYLDRLQRRWPELQAMPTYPALAIEA